MSTLFLFVVGAFVVYLGWHSFIDFGLGHKPNNYFLLVVWRLSRILTLKLGGKRKLFSPPKSVHYWVPWFFGTKGKIGYWCPNCEAVVDCQLQDVDLIYNYRGTENSKKAMRECKNKRLVGYLNDK